MNCIHCTAVGRIAAVVAKCSDLCSVRFGTFDHEGYVPDGWGIGGGDYVEFKWCLECGTIQDSWPMHPPTDVDEYDEENEV